VVRLSGGCFSWSLWCPMVWVALFVFGTSGSGVKVMEGGMVGWLGSPHLRRSKDPTSCWGGCPHITQERNVNMKHFSMQQGYVKDI